MDSYYLYLKHFDERNDILELKKKTQWYLN